MSWARELARALARTSAGRRRASGVSRGRPTDPRRSTIPRHPLFALAAALPLATAPLAAVEPLPAKELEVVELTAGVYAATWKDPLQDPIEGNSLFIVNDEDVVVVDTALMPSTTRRLIGELRKLTDKPVRYVINTHWHDDHHDGNYLYRELWPDVAIVSHVATRANILEYTYKPRPAILEEYKQIVARYTRWSESGLDDEGKPLVERRRKRAGELVALYSSWITEFSSMREMPPDLTFTDQLVLRRGERTIEVRWLGRGNTAGDVVVFLPAERIVATGDLLVDPVPFMFGSYYAEWIETLAAVDALAADVLVPGHGPVLRDREYLYTVQDLLRAVVAETRKAAEEGLTLEQTKERITLPEWRARFVGADERRGPAFDSFVLAPAIERAWRQAKGEDPPEGRVDG
ncbi:MAG TPA: MBL fold metallo-hydrolase [Thermoanaerobaculia bacterium]